MIGKLMKYDLRSALRKFGVLWAGLAALGLISGVSIRFVLDADRFPGVLQYLLGVVPIILLATLGIAMGVLTVVFICERFAKGLLGREGYLMLTLPVTSAEHILSKLLSSLILLFLTGLAFCVSGALMALVLGTEDIWAFLREAVGWLKALEYPRGTGWLLAETVVLGIVSTCVSVLHLYASISIGHLFPRHRIAWAVLAYVGINIVLSSGTVLGGLGLSGVENSLARYEFYFDEAGVHGGLSAVAGGLGMALLANLVVGLVFFFVTKLILDRRLNLE